MSSERKLILVTGATGKQGGAVARRLLGSEKWQVRALTRDTSKPAAEALRNLGAEVVQGDLDDEQSLARAVAGTYGVFSVQNFWETGYRREVEQGKKLADAAKAAGVKHFIYSSVGGAERNTGIQHFNSKWEIEEYVRARELPWTIFRPVFFMDNFSSPENRASILNGTLSLALPPKVKLQAIAVSDIGGMVTLAFNNPQTYLGKAMEIAGDELTGPEMAERFSRVLGRSVRYVEMPLEQLRSINKEYAVMMEWFVAEGYKADIAGLRRIYPGLMSFDDWLLSEAEWVRGLLVEEAVGT